MLKDFKVIPYQNTLRNKSVLPPWTPVPEKVDVVGDQDPENPLLPK